MEKFTHIITGLLFGFLILFIFKAVHFNLIYNFYELLLYLIFISLSSIVLDYIELGFLSSHRRQLHTLSILIIPLIIMVFYPIIGMAMFIGFLSHILLDLLTPTGCPLFLPFNSLYYKVFRKEDNAVRTGSASEKALTIILFMILVIVIFSCFLAISELSYGFYDIHHLISSSDNDSINETHLNDTKVSFNDKKVYVNVNLDIKGDEEKNLSFTDSDNRTSTLIVSNYDG